MHSVVLQLQIYIFGDLNYFSSTGLLRVSDYLSIEDNRFDEDGLVGQLRAFCAAIPFELDHTSVEQPVEITAHDARMAVELPGEIPD